MQSLILKLEAEVASRKRPQSELWPLARAASCALILFLIAYELGARSVNSAAGWGTVLELRSSEQSLAAQVDALRGQLDIERLQLERLRRAHDRSARYGIPADLALAIEEIALSENVDPTLAFELVRVESGFNGRAVSPVGALGYTQLMPATARLLVPGITRQQILHRETNLRLGFRFLRSLIRHYDGDIRLALLAYNRGPETVDRLLRSGVDPGNGYVQMVLGRR